MFPSVGVKREERATFHQEMTIVGKFHFTNLKHSDSTIQALTFIQRCAILDARQKTCVPSNSEAAIGM